MSSTHVDDFLGGVSQYIILISSQDVSYFWVKCPNVGKSRMNAFSFVSIQSKISAKLLIIFGAYAVMWQLGELNNGESKPEPAMKGMKLCKMLKQLCNVLP